MFQLQQQRNTHISVDCIKMCPYDPQLTAIGYYQTNPDTQGAISVTRLGQPESIHNIQPVQCSPLLHLVWGKFISQPNVYLLAAASRTNDVHFYAYNPQTHVLQLEKTVQVGQDIFCLYVDLITYPTHYHLLISSNESTVISLIFDPQFNITSRSSFSKHEFAVWTCRLSPHQQNVFACGDEVTSVYLYGDNQLISKNSTAHKGGICDLVFGKEYELYSGGFDGIVCTFDTRKLKQEVSRHEWGGTIWRVVPHSKNNEVILCNSSENKFQVVDYNNKELWNSGQTHKSLAYAADWNGTNLVTASFYDKKLCYWARTSQN